MAKRTPWPSDSFIETLESLLSRRSHQPWSGRIWGGALWAPGVAASLLGPIPSWPNPCSWRAPAHSLDFNRSRSLANRASGRRLRVALMAAQRERCALCSDRMEPMGQVIDRPNLDHIVALAVGGPDTATNLRLVHYHCNMLRAALEYRGTTKTKDYQRAHRSLSKHWLPPSKMLRSSRNRT